MCQRLEDERRARAATAGVEELRRFAGTYRLRGRPENAPPFDRLEFLVDGSRLRMRIPELTDPDATVHRGDVTVERARGARSG